MFLLCKYWGVEFVSRNSEGSCQWAEQCDFSTSENGIQNSGIYHSIIFLRCAEFSLLRLVLARFEIFLRAMSLTLRRCDDDRTLLLLDSNFTLIRIIYTSTSTPVVSL